MLSDPEYHPMHDWTAIELLRNYNLKYQRHGEVTRIERVLGAELAAMRDEFARRGLNVDGTPVVVPYAVETPRPGLPPGVPALFWRRMCRRVLGVFAFR